MEISAAKNFTSPTLLVAKEQVDTAPTKVNAFGIGEANKPEVQLSPQAQILQQNEQTQAQRRQSLESNQSTVEDSNKAEQISGNEFVRVSSSVGSASSNNLTTEKATEVYRSIQDLL